MSDAVPGFDPATDRASSQRQGRIRSAYQKLLERGDEETAEELRRQETLTKQVHFLRDIPEFDPKHDQNTTNTGKMMVKNVYEGLVELGHDDLAEELRDYTSVQPQKRRAIALAKRVDGKIDPMTGEVIPPDSEDTDQESPPEQR